MDNRKKGVILSYLYLVIQTVVNLIYVPMVLNLLGKSEYGLYQLVASVFAYISIFEASISSGVLRYYCNVNVSGDTKKKENILAIARIIYRILSVIIVVVGLVGIHFFRIYFKNSLTEAELNESSIMLVILIINMIVTMSNAIYLATINAHERFAVLKILAIIVQLMQPIICAFVLVRFPYAMSITVIQLLLNCMVSIYRFYYSRTVLSVTVRLHEFDSNLAKNIILFAGSILLASIADQIFWRADQILLGKMYSTTVVAVYSIGAQIYTNFSFVGTAISSVFFPKLSFLFSQKNGIEKISELFIQVGRISFQVVFLVLTAFYIFGKEFISFWVGKYYMEAYYIAMLILVPFTIDIIQNLGLSILQVVNKYNFRAKMYFVSAIANVFTTYFMARTWGGIGAAASTGMTMFVTSGLILNIYYQKVIKLDVVLFWKNILLILIKLLPVVVISYLVNETIQLPETAIFLIIKMSLYSIFYFLVLYLLVMNDEEKNILKGIVSSIKLRRHKS